MSTKADIIKMIRDEWAQRSANAELDLALGTMVRLAASTEFNLQGTIRLLVGGEYTSLVTSAMPASGMIDAIKRILDVGAVDATRASELAEVLTRCRAAFQQRNRYVHGMRLAATNNAVILTNNRRNGMFDPHAMDQEAILELAAEFAFLGHEISTWTYRLFVLDAEGNDDDEAPTP
ncbi:hypothetical protein IFM12275_24550 [Nocardia sputorum]|uniref:hypothetical protein n=1 Tax=Nocardia sputorum TaxID=2984338 RepID=UPI0024912593|nr:hypothetical protein [Nocardia sputorum]BDT92479.1 hypothetical protein IFM12275_24550 [Nocardia sputorum]